MKESQLAKQSRLEGDSWYGAWKNWESMPLQMEPNKSKGKVHKANMDRGRRWSSKMSCWNYGGKVMAKNSQWAQLNNGKWARKSWKIVLRMMDESFRSSDHKVSSNNRRYEFTPKEDLVLLKMQWEIGNKWSEIIKIMIGRTEN